MPNTIDSILADVCLDERVEDGIFDMSNNAHMEVLRETLVDKYQININDVVNIHNKMLEGKYPERQAYNKDGLLVTFPTPQHKQRAIQRGTHFEQNPVQAQQNVFGGKSSTTPQPQAPATPVPPPATPPTPPSQTSSQLPPSDQPVSPAPTAGATQGAPTTLPASQPAAGSDKQTLAVEPINGAPPSPPNFSDKKSPHQRAAEAQVVKQIMSGDDNTPSMEEQKILELNEILLFAKRMGYNSVIKIILEAIRKS